MYKKIRIYKHRWKDGLQNIEMILDRKIVVKNNHKCKFEIFQDGLLIASVSNKIIQVGGNKLKYAPSLNRIGNTWILPEGGEISLVASDRYFTVNDSEKIWISMHGGIIDNFISNVLDRRFKIREKHYDVYYDAELNPIYILCVLIVAVFDYST